MYIWFALMTLNTFGLLTHVSCISLLTSSPPYPQAYVILKTKKHLDLFSNIDYKFIYSGYCPVILVLLIYSECLQWNLWDLCACVHVWMCVLYTWAFPCLDDRSKKFIKSVGGFYGQIGLDVNESMYFLEIKETKLLQMQFYKSLVNII